MGVGGGSVRGAGVAGGLCIPSPECLPTSLPAALQPAPRAAAPTSAAAAQAAGLAHPSKVVDQTMASVVGQAVSLWALRRRRQRRRARVGAAQAGPRARLPPGRQQAGQAGVDTGPRRRASPGGREARHKT